MLFVSGLLPPIQGFLWSLFILIWYCSFILLIASFYHFRNCIKLLYYFLSTDLYCHTKAIPWTCWGWNQWWGSTSRPSWKHVSSTLLLQQWRPQAWCWFLWVAICSPNWNKCYHSLSLSWAWKIQHPDLWYLPQWDHLQDCSSSSPSGESLHWCSAWHVCFRSPEWWWIWWRSSARTIWTSTMDGKDLAI